MSKPKMGPQDLPPPGGYPAFPFDRVKLRNFLKGPWTVAGFIALNIVGFRLYYQNWVEVRRDMIADKSAELAAFPIVYAENDRAMLKYLKQLHQLEEDIMKDFPLWETGTFLGEPVYKTLPEDTYVEPNAAELYAFTDPYDLPLTMKARIRF
ncbi:NADH dehydrogenase [ubiquinone] 1 alpha subcomplex subunit 13 [Anthophora quadrimaculata]